MASLMPVAFYGLTVPPGDDLVPASLKPAPFRITMAAINPSEAVEQSPDSSTPPRATLKIVRLLTDDDDDDDEDYDSDDDLDNESDTDDEEVNGGPSDPSRSKKARKAKAVAELKKALEEDDDVDEDAMDTDFDSSKGSNGIVSSKAKGKAKATDDSSSEDEDEDEDGTTEFVLCTLDPNKVYQQPLDITCGSNEEVYFQVSGTHTVYLTGNYVTARNVAGGSMDELDYDLSPDDDEFDEDEDEESDELDSLADPRITEVDTDEEEQEDEAPKLVKKTPTKAEAKRGADAVEKPKKPAQKTPNQTKGKRGAEDDADNEDDQKPESLDDIMAKSLKPGDAAAGGEPKLSRRQLKKLKNNAGKAAQPPTNGDDAKQDAPSEGSPSAAKSEKKVQFSKDSDAGRHGEQTDGKKDNKSPGKGEKKDEKKEEKRDEKKNEKKDQKKDQKKGENKAQKSVDDKAESKDNKTDGKSGLGNQRTVQGVIISDGKLGTGPPAKQGSTVSLRYIGKLQSNNRQFDANKSGPPFRFKIGSNEVIKGWDIGVKGMAVGGERRIIIPPELGYGSKKLDGIPPNSTLVFDLKLLSIK